MQICYFDGDKMSAHCNEDREVYHYTSPENFLSILKYKKLWFSDSQFMNDRSEYVYIKEIFERAAKGTTHETKIGEDKNRFVDEILGFPYGGLMPKPLPKGKKGFSRGLLFTRYYLLCASLTPDNHSLWNYYIKNNRFQGYNIGIAVNSFIETIFQPTWKLTHGFVNYNREMQIRQLHRQIVELSKQFEENIQSGKNELDCVEHYQEELAGYLLQRCMFYKSPAFSHENEYRFVIEAPAITVDTGGTKSVVDYHVGGHGLIVPHLEVKFEPEKIVNNITLAPMMEREVAKQGVHRLWANILDNSKSQITVNFSQIDVRY
ncbi:MAG: DUF2971 domain-containing protein [Lachnospiraceae bacterium]|nr:DUF2971 domain-containing protein [Lachnospiraceae bacterium]